MDLILLIAKSLLNTELNPLVAVTAIAAIACGVVCYALYVILQISQKGRGR
jgi:hypothetical protein